MMYIGIFQIMEPRNQLKADFETSITFERLGIFYAVFTVVLRRMSSIILYVCLYLHWGLFKGDKILCSNTYQQKLKYTCFKMLFRIFQYVP